MRKYAPHSGWDLSVDGTSVYNSFFVILRAIGSVKRDRNIIPVVLLLVALGFPATLGGETYHVWPSGDDDNPGTLEKPWKTIRKANQTLIAGDTAEIHPGTYADQIRPANSGTSDQKRITYRAHGGGDVIVTIPSNVAFWKLNAGAIALGGKSYVTVDGVKVLAGWSTRKPLFGNMTESHHCTVQNSQMEGAVHYGFIFNHYHSGEHRERVESSYNVFRNNIVRGSIDLKGGTSTEDLILISADAHHNLIENNVLDQAEHVVLNVFGSYRGPWGPHHNVFRNNVIRNTWHTAMSFWKAGEGNLIEGNRTEASYMRNDWPDKGRRRMRHKDRGDWYPGNSFQFGQPRAIVRYNVLLKGGRAGLGVAGSPTAGNSVFNYFYNNTIVNNRGYGVRTSYWPNRNPRVDVGRNVYINNIVYGNNLNGGPQIYYEATHRLPRGVGDVWRRNLIGRPAGEGKLAPDPNDEILRLPGRRVTAKSAQATLRASKDPLFWRILQVDPGFVDFAGEDYSLRPDSALVDAGEHLTFVTAADAGDGIFLMVAGAGFFQDGLGIPSVQPDRIAIGRIGNVVQIASVDYTANKIVLKGPLKRQRGDRVWVYKRSDGTQVLFGPRPDVGALEYGSPTKTAPHQRTGPSPSSAPSGGE